MKPALKYSRYTPENISSAALTASGQGNRLCVWLDHRNGTAFYS